MQPADNFWLQHLIRRWKTTPTKFHKKYESIHYYKRATQKLAWKPTMPRLTIDPLGTLRTIFCDDDQDFADCGARL